MSLSYDFHVAKKNPYLQYIISARYTVLHFVRSMIFYYIPLVADLGVACVYLFYLFGPYMSLLTGTMALSYFWVSARSTMRSVVLSQAEKLANRNTEDALSDSLGGWETVQYFNRAEDERKRYLNAVEKEQVQKRQTGIFDSLEKAMQDLVLNAGLAAAVFLAAYQVFENMQPLENLVILIGYWAHLRGMLLLVSSD